MVVSRDSAVLSALVAAWMGGELVGRLGVGVDDGANLNAPSSLLGRPEQVLVEVAEIHVLDRRGE